MNREEIKMWFGRISRCETLLKERENERKQIVKLYLGEFFGSPTSNNSDLSEVNFVYEYVKVKLASIYSRNPHIFVRTKNPRLGEFAETMETVINNYFETKRVKPKMKSIVIDAILNTPGFAEIGYFFTTEKNRIQKQLESEFPELKDGKTKTEDEQGITDETIKEDDVFLSHLSPFEVLFPDGYHDIRECPYIFKKQVIRLNLLLKNKYYKNTEKLRNRKTLSEKISTVSAYNIKALPRMFDDKYSGDDELVEITLYHCYDRLERKRFTLAEGFLEDTLHEGEWDYLIDGFPIYPLIFNEVPKTNEKSNAFGLSDIVPMLPQLKELSLISSAMLRHRKRSGTLLLGKRGQITETEATNIQKANDVEFILLDDNSEAAVRGFTPPALPNDFYALRGIILEDLMRTSGYNQLLGVSKGVNTATESENIRAGALLRQAEAVDVIEDFIAQVAQGLAGLLWQFIQDKKRIEEIIGEPVTEQMWPTLPEDLDEARRIIQKQMFFTIEAGSSRPPKDEAIERKQWLDLIDKIKLNFPNKLKDDIILKQLLKKFEFKDIERAIVGYDEQETATAQEENKLLLQGIPCLPGVNENSLLHLQVHSQAYQTPGLAITQQMDEHILKTKQFYEMKNPQVLGNKANRPTKPETGVPDYSDLVGSTRSMPGTGVNTGGSAGGQ